MSDIQNIFLKTLKPVLAVTVYKSKAKLKRNILWYFELCDYTEKPYTIAGLAVYLGITIHTLNKYRTLEPFKDIIEMTLLFIESKAEEDVREGKKNPIGTIFWLKNRFKEGWKDTQEIELKSGDTFNQFNIGKVIVGIDLDNLGKLSKEQLQKLAAYQVDEHKDPDNTRGIVIEQSETSRVVPSKPAHKSNDTKEVQGG